MKSLFLINILRYGRALNKETASAKKLFIHFWPPVDMKITGTRNQHSINSRQGQGPIINLKLEQSHWNEENIKKSKWLKKKKLFFWIIVLGQLLRLSIIILHFSLSKIQRNIKIESCKRMASTIWWHGCKWDIVPIDWKTELYHSSVLFYKLFLSHSFKKFEKCQVQDFQIR